MFLLVFNKKIWVEFGLLKKNKESGKQPSKTLLFGWKQYNRLFSVKKNWRIVSVKKYILVEPLRIFL